jgi:hypothetical protein
MKASFLIRWAALKNLIFFLNKNFAFLYKFKERIGAAKETERNYSAKFPSTHEHVYSDIPCA